MNSITCGYGTTLFVAQDKQTEEESVFGCGMNTDSQIGYLEMPRGSGRNDITTDKNIHFYMFSQFLLEFLENLKRMLQIFMRFVKKHNAYSKIYSDKNIK